MIKKSAGIVSALVIIFCSLNLYGADRNVSSFSVSKANQKIENLKKSMANASGKERVKIMKLIAENENKVREKKNSSASRR